ncbi:MAG: adenosylmethionine--8-amino-7-oxononanoate transaminase [Planctomycetota bacterium]|nr:adenosylmethionine--8-amino-7-oxononanoate transaminase [Planctomycetota bacterium]
MNENARKALKADLNHVWHPFTQHSCWDGEEALVIERGCGCTLFDADGNEYIDGVSSLWVNVHGHANIAIDDAVRLQLANISHSTYLGLTNVPASLFAGELVDIAPGRLNRVLYSDSGAEAVEIALKMAFQFHKQNGNSRRNKFVALDMAYHGDTIGSVSVGGISTFHSIFEPLLFEVLRAPVPHCYRCPFGREPDTCDRECFLALCKVFDEHGSEICAAVIEPRMQGAAGMISHPDGYLAHMEKLCREHGAFLIADEVATGFGRTGHMFSVEAEGVEPDLMCLGKGITGGYLPLAATLATEEIFEGFLGEPDSDRAFFHGHSYTGNQLAGAAARASLRQFGEHNVLENVAKRSDQLEEGLERFRELEVVGDVRRRGMMVGIELVAHRESKRPFPPDMRAGHRVIMNARRRGAILRPLGNVVVLMPPLVISHSELDELVSITYNSVHSFQKGLDGGNKD